MVRRLLRWLLPAIEDQTIDEVVVTYRLGCRDALRRRGMVGLGAHIVAEWWNFMSIGATRGAGRQTKVQAGRDVSGAARVPQRPGVAMLSRVFRDVRVARRSLAAWRGTALLAVATLGIGLGINAAVFSVLDAVLLRPVPYHRADRLAVLWTHHPDNGVSFRGGFSPGLIRGWREQTDLFDRVEAAEQRTFVYAGLRGAELIHGVAVTPGLPAMLGVVPLAGRPFAGGDGQDGTPARVLISERFWNRHLGRSPEAVGGTISLDGVDHAVIGILPAEFRYPTQDQELWVPFDVTSVSADDARRTGFEPLVRMRDGLTFSTLAERVLALGSEIHQAAAVTGDPRPIGGGVASPSATLRPIGQSWDQRTNRSLLVLGGAVLFLLLIVCANVANLLVSRALHRSRDRAMRVALGASRADLVREALIEHLALGLAGAALGLLVAQLAVDATVAVLPMAMTATSLNAIDLDSRSLIFLAGTAMATILLFGLPPAVMAGRQQVSQVLGRESRAMAGSRAARRWRSCLIVGEVALSVILLIGAALMTRSLAELQAIDVGMDTEGLVTVRVGLPSGAYSDSTAQDLFTRDAIARLASDSAVTSASAGSLPPGSVRVAFGTMTFDGRPDEQVDRMVARVYPAWPGYFRTAGIRLLEGRVFQQDEIEGAAIISRDFASRYWPSGSALGQRFRIGRTPELPWRTIVGVVGEVRRLSEDDDSDQFELYYPPDQMQGVLYAAQPGSTIASYQTFLVRTDLAGQLMGRIGDIVHAVDSGVVVSEVTLVERTFADAIARPRVVLLMLGVFAASGLLLAAAGLYSVLSYLVSLRLREIGIRLALGAAPRDIGRTIVGSGLGLAGIGVALGLVASLGLVELMQSLLYEVQPSDPAAVAGACVVLLSAAGVAAWRPARRAMRVDPVALLRES